MVNDELPQGRIRILIQKLKQFLEDRPLIRGMDCFLQRSAVLMLSTWNCSSKDGFLLFDEGPRAALHSDQWLLGGDAETSSDDGLWCFCFRIFNLQNGTDILLLPTRNHQPRTSSFILATWN